MREKPGVIQVEWVCLQCWMLVCLATGSLAGVVPNRSISGDYMIRSWQTAQGLPENSATAMVQTPDGYLLFGTFNGLVRFDGIHFTVITPQNTPGLPNLGIVNLHLDREGGFWVSTVGGITYHRNGNWRRFGRQEGWTGDYVRFFAEAPDGTLYVNTFDRRILRFDGQRFQELPSPPGESKIQFVYADRQGRVQVAGRHAICTWTGKEWRSVALPEEISRAPQDLMWGTGPNGRLWGVSGRTLWQVEEGKVVRRVKLDQSLGPLWSLSEDPQGGIWVCSYSDGLYYISDAGRVTAFNTSNGLTSNSIRFVFFDRQGNRWVGTSGGGLLRLRERRFRSIGREEGLPDLPVKAVAPEKDGGILIATYGKGTYRYRDGRLSPLMEGALRLAYAQSLLVDRTGRVWVGAYQDGLMWVEGNAVHRPPPGMPQTVDSLFEDSHGRIWVSGEDKVIRTDGQSFERFEVEHAGGGIQVRSFAEDRATGRIWAGGDQGLLRLEGTKFVPVRDPSGARLPPIVHLHVAGRETLWLGVANEGLIYWRNGAVSRVGPDLAPMGTVGGILEDGEWLWLATNHGVWRFRAADLETAALGGAKHLEWQHFDTADGLPSEECTFDHQPSVGKDSYGRLWFSTLKGAAVIDPRNLALDTSDIVVKLDGIQYVNGAGTPQRLSRYELVEGHAKLPAGSRSLRVAYTALEFSDPEEVLFAFELRNEGAVVASGQRTERELEFHKLDAGAYTLSIRARNSDGHWGDLPATLQLTVAPFLWERRSVQVTFLLLLAGVIAGATAWTGRRGSRRALEQMAVEKERAEMKARLMQAGKMESIGRLAGGVAHDFNNLLTVINGYSDLVLADTRLSEGSRDRLRQVRKAGDRAAELVRQLLAFSRRQVIEPKPLDLNTLVRDTAQMSQRLLREDIEVVLVADPEPVYVLADAAQIQQVLLNLVVNARDAMPNGGTLRIQTGIVGEDVVLEVSDTGVGMSEETRARIFEPFFTTKEVGQGTGLGLATVFGVVEQAGGRITVDSQPNKGSVFRILLPRQATPVPHETAATPCEAPAPSGQETVLVVEDQPDVRRFLSSGLRSLGYQVCEAANGNEALATARTHSVDLLITDVVMPEMDGQELARRFAKEYPRTRVLFISGYSEDVLAHQGVLQPGVAYLSKPFGPETLSAAVRKALNKSPEY